MVRCASGDASTSSRATLTLASRSTIGPSSLVRMGSGTKLQSSDPRGTNVPHSEKSMLRGSSRHGFVNWLVDKVSGRSEEHKSELQSLMRISYAVFCLKKKNNNDPNRPEGGKETGKDYCVPTDKHTLTVLTQHI